MGYYDNNTSVFTPRVTQDTLNRSAIRNSGSISKSKGIGLWTQFADYITQPGAIFGNHPTTLVAADSTTVPNQTTVPATTAPSLPSEFNLSSTGNGSGTTFVPTTFQGQVYNDAASLEAAKLAYYQKQHDTYANSLKNAYDAGLITFDERKAALEQNRQDLINSKNTGLGAVQASYAQASPDVIQSSQGDYQNKILDQFNTANAQLGTATDTAAAPTAYGDLARSQADYGTNYQNAVQQNDQNLLNQQDAGANTLANYQASQASSAKAAANNTIDTQSLLQNLGDTYAWLNATQAPKAEADKTLGQGLVKAGIPANQVDPILNYFYSNYYDRYRQAKGIP